MNSDPENKITCACPSGHKVRGEASLCGEKVICPRCKRVFVFGHRDDQPSRVSDTGVMRILGDMPAPLPPAGADDSPETKPCGRCNIAIDASASVCKHCNSYVGVMPRFMRSLNQAPTLHQN
ncbi:hypothetical protein [Planctomycetes bacterium K23_9]|uniref:Uncharacterized protein n=1 Tax=Stieleria marina TaxID=1930275 RepID=A0A517NZP6_9BACT|nr:hypothetical protein K239x_46090 [Planctomycetes bacterium K23_9]